MQILTGRVSPSIQKQVVQLLLNAEDHSKSVGQITELICAKKKKSGMHLLKYIGFLRKLTPFISGPYSQSNDGTTKFV
jgi:hypothetical protein